MGRVENQAPEVKNASIMQHFCHPHPLEEEEHFNLQNITQGVVTFICSGCKLPPSGTMYVCRPCNFTLHETCAKLPQLITHPSHPIHTLTLLPVSLYPGGIFSCDACNNQGNGFSYHCHTCDFDLHVLCAIKPLRIKHQLHPCQVELTFVNPYGSNKGFVCDVCSKMGSKQWLYRCKTCSFDVHLDCAYATGPRITTQPQQTMQQFNSFPGKGHPNAPGLSGSASMGIPNQVMQNTGTMGNYQLQPGNQLMQGGPGQMPNYQTPVGTPIIHNANIGSMPNYQLPNQVNYQQAMIQNSQASMTNNLMTAAMQGMVEGAAQAVGQNLVQSIIANVDGGGD
ncbi:hypothetical protein Leryth_006453, partial [Lithospermum erythrorhizon]